jgi:hypothetical protein
MTVRLFIGSALIFIICGCAKISAPSGGARDRTPPVVVKSIPVNGAKNFKGDKLHIEFDEYVTLDNINEKFMVSPPVKKKPRVLIKGKAVEVEFENKLKDSTTYTFYFQDAIKDLNEGNILDNYQFVLSTGPVIDSLSVTGNIYNANNLEVPEKTQVIMYSELADSAVVKHLPQYITRVDPTGYFRIDNVRPGTYRLYGLKDADNSKNYDSPDEDFAFMDSLVVITPGKNFIPKLKIVKDTTLIKKDTTKGPETVKKGSGKPAKTMKKGVDKNGVAIKGSADLKKDASKVEEPAGLIGEYHLFQFAAQKMAHYLTGSRRDLKYQLIYILSLPPDTMKVEFSIPGTDSKAYFTEHSKDRDTLKVWLTDSSLYSRQRITTLLKYPFTDSLGITGYKKDSIEMRYLARTTKGTKIKKTVFRFETNLSSSLKPGQSVILTSKTPFGQIDTSRIKLYEVEQATRQKVPYQLVKDSANSCRLYLKTKLVESKKYLFTADSASFSNIYKEQSDSIGINFSIKDAESYEKLTLDIKNYEGNRIIQLLDKSEKLVGERYMTKNGKAVFPLLDPGFYRARVIYDLNGDGKWTTGDFTTHRQPEPVSYYPVEIELRAGFELIQTWDISVKNFKDPKLRMNKKGNSPGNYSSQGSNNSETRVKPGH